jgi:hypothetical protein
MATLTEEQKQFIVQRLACFRTPSQVVADVKEEFGVDLPREQVRQYNPKQVSVAAKWEAIFEATREAFIASAADEGVAHQAYRIRELGELYRAAVKAKNRKEAAAHLRQVAEEVGGAYTNARQLSGPGGGPIPTQSSQILIYLPSNGREAAGGGGS